MPVSADSVVFLVVAIALMIYLLATLLAPERF